MPHNRKSPLARGDFLKFLVWILLVLFVTSCAHHPRLAPIIKIPDFYEYKIKADPLEIVLDPYERPYKTNYLFSTDITEKGILPLHLIIWNQSGDAFDLGSAKMHIVSFPE